ncbi:hypothetical protein [Streptomyces sp. NPDC058755]|uniref:hypothetical protein n=1 Tax=Streptomyces sp. NPDC058755 TaxID=3346624 RepID=UPI00369211CB
MITTKYALAKAVVDLIISIELTVGEDLLQDVAASITEPVKELLRSTSREVRSDLGQLFRAVAEDEGVPARREAAFDLADTISGTGPGDNSSTSSTTDRVLAKAFMGLMNDVELADEEDFDPDTAIKIMEAVSGYLAHVVPEQVHQNLVPLFRQVAEDEDDPAQRELAADFPEAIGLVSED